MEANGEWSLFCPNEAPGLADSWGPAFDKLYLGFEAAGRAKKVIRAQQLWFAILDAQVRPPHQRDHRVTCLLRSIPCLWSPRWSPSKIGGIHNSAQGQQAWGACRGGRS